MKKVQISPLNPLKGIAVKLRIKESKIKIFDLVFCI